VDDGENNVKFFYPALTFAARAADWTLEPEDVMVENIPTLRNLLSRDEEYVATYAYNAGLFSTFPLHNLGYIKSDESKPSSSNPASEYSLIYSDLQNFELITRPDLRYQDGDKIYIPSLSVLSVMQVKEIWQHKKDGLQKIPPWHMKVSAIQYFSGTIVGNMPAEMTAVTPMTPLYTGEFDHALSTEDDTIQAAFDKLDDVTFKRTGDTINGNLFVNGNYQLFEGYALQIASTNGNPVWLQRTVNNDYYGPYTKFQKASGTLEAPTSVAVNDNLGSLLFMAFDGTDYRNAAMIRVIVPHTPGSGDTPGAIHLNTTPDSSTTLALALYIDDNQSLRTAKGPYVGNVYGTPTVDDIICDGTIKTAAGKEWNLGGYTAGAPTADGYLTVVVDGVTYKVLVDKV
jgi:hypothetical protein